MDKDINRTAPWETALVTTSQLDLTPFTTTLCMGPAIQPALNPSKNQATNSQALQKKIVGIDKGFTQIQVYNIHSFSLIHCMDHLAIEGDQAGQSGPAFLKATLTDPDHLFFCMFHMMELILFLLNDLILFV